MARKTKQKRLVEKLSKLLEGASVRVINSGDSIELYFEGVKFTVLVKRG